jgi:hypothetical protein
MAGNLTQSGTVNNPAAGLPADAAFFAENPRISGILHEH